METFKFNTHPRTPLKLDPDFSPIILNNRAFASKVEESFNPEEIHISLERPGDMFYTTKCLVFNEAENQEDANFLYVERLIKTLLWIKGGYRLFISGPKKLCERIIKAYSYQGLRSFDVRFMEKVYHRTFEVLMVESEVIPQTKEASNPVGRNLDGYRIGFDAGGSDRKVSAVINGEPVYTEEVIWHPKTNSDPDYHFHGILDSIERAASKMPRVDAIGISSAGIYIDNQVAIASLFRKIPEELYDLRVKNIYLDIQKKFNNIPIEVANDGDVTALAGSMSLQSNNVLGIAMGTSEAVGYIDGFGNITGWLNELSFVPVDYNSQSARDEWSQDYGVGSTYFSQDAVIKLVKSTNIKLDENLSPAEKLKVVQKLAEAKDQSALEIFKTIGVYLGYALAYYAQFYTIEKVLILGRVTSGIGGELILEHANHILKTEFHELFSQISVTLPSEESRRVGQSIAAASLPVINKELYYEVK